jgi:hypothetical protein
MTLAMIAQLATTSFAFQDFKTIPRNPQLRRPTRTFRC